MSSAIDIEFPAGYFFVEEFDFNDDLDGECEDCGRVVAEWSLFQCQYGFCGRFFCENCGFRCTQCGDNEPRSVCLCSPHARMVYPTCDGCKRQYCDICSTTAVVQCKSCLKQFCTGCQNQEKENIAKSETCDKCGTKVLRSLQEICRHTIRGSISGAVRTPVNFIQSSDIDRNVQHLPLPGPVKNYICYN